MEPCKIIADTHAPMITIDGEPILHKVVVKSISFKRSINKRNGKLSLRIYPDGSDIGLCKRYFVCPLDWDYKNLKPTDTVKLVFKHPFSLEFNNVQNS